MYVSLPTRYWSWMMKHHLLRALVWLPSVYCFSRSSVRLQSSISSLRSFQSNNRMMMMMKKKEDPMIELGLPRPLILGSGSFTRKLILKEMGIEYELIVRSIDEKGLGDRNGDPSELVLTLAKAKGDYLVSCLNADPELLPSSSSGFIVLTADQVVTHDGSILEKPESIEEAKMFVHGYGSVPPKTVGACVLTHIPTGIQVSGVDTAQINFAPTVATSDLIDQLLQEDAPVLSCAGGLMVEHPLVKQHIERIDGTEDSVMGLSKDLVLRLLQEIQQKLLIHSSTPTNQS